MDFEQDWRVFIEAELTRAGLTYSPQESLDNLTLTFLNAIRRRVEARPRRVHESRELQVPSEYRVQYDELKQFIIDGKDLLPYLSKKVSNPTEKDLLLNDWGVHHLHFSPNPKRTKDKDKEILFVRFTNEEAYIIQAFPHGADHPYTWVNKQLVEIMHSNWPEAISGGRKYGVPGEKLDQQERLNVRNGHFNVIIELADGICYGSIGGGIVPSGHCFADIKEAAQILSKLREWERLVRTNEQAFRSSLEISAAEPLIIRLIVEKDGFRLYVPNRGVRITMTIA
jgi:hypothetical protein